MRYTIGRKYIFIHEQAKLKPKQNMVTPFPCVFKPWEDEMENQRILVLTCAEHHKVRNTWAKPEDEPDCDGFIFLDAEGGKWYNQYPTASYGQVDDSADGRVMWSGWDKEVDQRSDRFFMFEDLGRKLESMSRGIRDFQRELGNCRANREGYDAKTVAKYKGDYIRFRDTLRQHRDRTIQNAKAKSGCFDIKPEPWCPVMKDGTRESFPDILKTSVMWTPEDREELETEA
jgi:hypothetical protein